MINPKLPNFRPRVLGDCLLSITTDPSTGESCPRWYRWPVVTSIGVEGREIWFRVSEDVDALGYCAGRLAEPAGAQRELFELIRLLNGAEPEAGED